MRVQLNRQKNKENKERLIDEIDKFNEDFNAGLIDPKELIEQLEEETKIKIKY